MLQLTGATYRYAGYAKPVLHDIDLRLDDGEIVGLVGPNEAGKSTLFEAIFFGLFGQALATESGGAGHILRRNNDQQAILLKLTCCAIAAGDLACIRPAAGRLGNMGLR